MFFLLGVGLSVHGTYRVATEKAMFAMPETGIGLVPDVGGGFFLPRLASPIGSLGMFLGLTGHRLKGEDCLHAGIATHGCRRESLADLKEELFALDDAGQIGRVLDKYSRDFPTTEFSLAPHKAVIEECFSKGSVEEIVACLGSNGGDWGRKVADTIGRMSPTSLKVAFRQITEGSKAADLASALQTEFRLARRCCEDRDFYEGVRALLVDKDNRPKWVPDRLEDVTEAKVDHYFSRLPEDEELRF